MMRLAVFQAHIGHNYILPTLHQAVDRAAERVAQHRLGEREAHHAGPSIRRGALR
jgi:hypothetical protein